MSKFNTLERVVADTVNRAGGEAYTETPEVALVNLLLTSFMKEKHYESASDEQKRLDGLLGKVDPKFAAKAGVYARQRFGMRSITHYVGAWIAKNVKGAIWTGGFFKNLVHRPDDILEVLACYEAINGKLHPIPAALKRGFAAKLSEIGAYGLAKYRGDGKKVALVDAVNLLHPRHSEALGKLVKGDLAPVDTWETAISGAGKVEGGEEAVEAKKTEEWARLIRDRKLGYFALIRNIRNILDANLDDAAFEEFLDQLKDQKAILKSLVMPFRIIVAYKVVQVLHNTAEFRRTRRGVHVSQSSLVGMALSEAMDHALSNAPLLKGKTLVALDRSSSMSTVINERCLGKTPVPISVSDVGAVFAAALVKMGADLIVFCNEARYVKVDRIDPILSIAPRIPNPNGGTNFHSIFQTANTSYDRIIILSDMQAWIGGNTPDGTVEAYKRRTSCSPNIFCFNLASYGDTQFPAHKVYQLAGFSDKVFDTMALLETDRRALVHEIEALEL